MNELVCLCGDFLSVVSLCSSSSGVFVVCVFPLSRLSRLYLLRRSDEFDSSLLRPADAVRGLDELAVA